MFYYVTNIFNMKYIQNEALCVIHFFLVFYILLVRIFIITEGAAGHLHHPRRPV